MQGGNGAMKKLSILVLIAVALSTTSCFTLFSVKVDGFKAEKGRIAVLTGEKNGVSYAYACYVTEYLSKKSKLKVLSQKIIKRSLPSYPQKIAGPYVIDKKDYKIEPVYKRSDVKRIQRLERGYRDWAEGLMWTIST